MKTLRAFGPRHRLEQVFSDFVECAALALSNRADLSQFEAREARYLEVIQPYQADELRAFSEMLGDLMLAFLDLSKMGEFADVLGSLYMRLDLGSARAGQFFTPYNVSRMMAAMQVGDGTDIRAREFVTVSDPACGAGGMIIAFADAARSVGLDHLECMHATCIDIDIRCVHMTYVQLSLLDIPAVVIHGNSLANERRSVWLTPAHVAGRWSNKLRARDAKPEAAEPVRPGRANASAARFKERLRNFLKVRI
ncbi:N-6 DNA methylase [Burkholderia gladioli]|uniref:N-6 DNA methylase n=1 Tax=Burkholderia gladioli TaxID=28095 RepID=UPI001FC8957E|nr:N-6 DNA methylase [Burkholderia gladioli]